MFQFFKCFFILCEYVCLHVSPVQVPLEASNIRSSGARIIIDGGEWPDMLAGNQGTHVLWRRTFYLLTTELSFQSMSCFVFKDLFWF